METKEVKTAAKETAKEKPSPRRYTARQQAETAAAEKASAQSAPIEKPAAKTVYSRNQAEQNAHQPKANGSKPMDARALSKLSVAELTKLAVNYNVEDISGLRKQQLIGKIIAVQAKQNGSVYGGGVLEILPDGFGFLRSEENNYLAGGEDIYVSPSQIKRLGLKTMKDFSPCCRFRKSTT